MRRLLALAGLAMVLLAACGGTDRPEGVVERWLISLNQGKAGEPQKYAPGVSKQVLPNWRSCDPGSLDVIEVGTHATGTEGYPGTVLVPYRIKYASDLSSCDTSVRPAAPTHGAAVVTKRADVWQIIGVEGAGHAAYLRVPSEGGKRIGNASAISWIVAIAISAALMLVVGFVIGLTPKPLPLPSRKQ